MNMTQKLEAKAEIGILKPASEVFEAIADPEKMANYFISKSTGRLEEGKTVMWRFPEFDLEFPVRGGRIERHRFISFFWDSDGIEHTVEISLIMKTPSSTIVKITEKGRDNNEAGLRWLTGNTAGWANFLACLKAWMEYGINLRKGAFDHMVDK